MAGSGWVVVVGSVNVDLVVSVDHLPARAETVTGGTFSRHHGGKGANQAVAAARLGAEVCFVGAVGDDANGRDALEALRAEGIETSGAAVMPDTPTGLAGIVVDRAGENQIAVASGANASLDARTVRRALDAIGAAAAGQSARSGVLLVNLEIGDDALIAAAGWAAEQRIAIVLNPAPARPLAPELLAARPILVLNEGEARQLSGVDELERAAAELAGRTDSAVVVTVGPRGALLAEAASLARLAAFVVEAVDTTGAGDTLVGALAAGLAEGRSLRRALERAMAAAALSVMSVGAREGMPDRAAVERFLRERGRR